MFSSQNLDKEIHQRIKTSSQNNTPHFLRKHLILEYFVTQLPNLDKVQLKPFSVALPIHINVSMDGMQ